MLENIYVLCGSIEECSLDKSSERIVEFMKCNLNYEIDTHTRKQEPMTFQNMNDV